MTDFFSRMISALSSKLIGVSKEEKTVGMYATYQEDSKFIMPQNSSMSKLSFLSLL